MKRKPGAESRSRKSAVDMSDAVFQSTSQTAHQAPTRRNAPEVRFARSSGAIMKRPPPKLARARAESRGIAR
jgi:hypothetical protein